MGSVPFSSEGEIVKVTSVNGTTVNLTRAEKGSTAAAHGAGMPLYQVRRTTFVYSFAFNFFGSAEGGNWAGRDLLPSQRIVAVDGFVSNRKGDSPVKTNNFSALVPNNGLRTLSGGQVDLVVEGVLAIQSNAAPQVSVDRTMSVRDVFATVDLPPAGADLKADVLVAGQVLATVTIPAGATISNLVDGAGLGWVNAGDLFTLDITQVGSTFGGERLVVTVRF